MVSQKSSFHYNMSSDERWLHHSKLNRSLDRSNYQILWPFSADNFCAYYNPGYTISISFSCVFFFHTFLVFFFLHMWFNVVEGTNIANHYHFIYNLSWMQVIKFNWSPWYSWNIVESGVKTPKIKSNQKHIYNLSWNENTKKTKDVIN